MGPIFRKSPNLAAILMNIRGIFISRLPGLIPSHLLNPSKISFMVTMSGPTIFNNLWIFPSLSIQ